MAGEFDLIARYFNWPTTNAGVVLSVGDDAALLSLIPHHHLAISVDTLVPGVHFPLNTHPADVGHKALSVNVSDMAAMGAKPRWFTLALTLSEYDTDWLAGFSQGLKQAADDYGVALIGGDTTSGPQTISIQIMGEVAPNEALKRADAKQGDVLFITSTLGDAAAGLAISIKHDRSQLDTLPQTSSQRIVKDSAQGSEASSAAPLSSAEKHCLSRLNRPTARVIESRVICQYANACIDVSDGLLQDLSHILTASKLGAIIDTDAMQFSHALSSLYERQQCLSFALNGGDDYELLFSIPAEKCEAFQQAMAEQQLACQAIGYLTPDTGVIQDHLGQLLTAKGFQHF